MWHLVICSSANPNPSRPSRFAGQSFRQRTFVRGNLRDPPISTLPPSTQRPRVLPSGRFSTGQSTLDHDPWAHRYRNVSTLSPGCCLSDSLTKTENCSFSANSFPPRVFSPKHREICSLKSTYTQPKTNRAQWMSGWSVLTPSWKALPLRSSKKS